MADLTVIGLGLDTSGLKAGAAQAAGILTGLQASAAAAGAGITGTGVAAKRTTAKVATLTIAGQTFTKTAKGVVVEASAAAASVTALGAASTKASTSLTTLGTSAGVASRGLLSTKIQAGLAAGALGVLAVGTAAAGKQFASFGTSMARVGSLLPGQQARVKELGSALLDMEGDADDLSKALFQQISAFGDSADAVDALNDAYKAAIAGGTDMESAVNLTIAATKAFGDTSAEARSKALDLAFVTNKIGVTTFPELAASMGAVTGIAASLGVTIEEVFAGFSALTGTIGNTNDTATALRATYAELLKPQGKLLEAMKKLGAVTGGELLRSTGGFIDALKALDRQAKKDGLAISDLFGNIRALRAVLPLASSQTQKFRDALEENTNSLGASNTAFQEFTTGMGELGFEASRTAEEFEKLFIAAGEGQASTLAAAFRGITEALKENRDQAVLLSRILGGAIMGRIFIALTKKIALASVAAGGFRIAMLAAFGGLPGLVAVAGGVLAAIIIPKLLETRDAANEAADALAKMFPDDLDKRTIEKQIFTLTNLTRVAGFQADDTRTKLEKLGIAFAAAQTATFGDKGAAARSVEKSFNIPDFSARVHQLEEQLAGELRVFDVFNDDLQEALAFRNELLTAPTISVTGEPPSTREADKLAAEERRRLAAITSIIAKLREQRDVLGETTAATTDRHLATLKATDDDREAARQLINQIRAIRARTDAEDAQLEIQQEINEARAIANALLREEQAQLDAFELDRIKDDAKELADALGVGLVDAIRGVEDAFTNMIDSILEQMARLAIQRSLIDPLLRFVDQALAPADKELFAVAADAAGSPTFTGEGGNRFPGSNVTASPKIDTPSLSIVESNRGSGSVIVNVELTQNINSQFLDAAGAAAVTEQIADRAAERVVETIENSQAFRQSIRG